MAAPRPSVSKEVFLDAALAIADEFGPDAVTTRSLGAALGLDSTTVYRYFGNKDVLLGSLFDHVVGQAVAECAQLGGTPYERIRAMVAAYRNAFFRHPNVARLNSYMGDMLAADLGRAPNTARLSKLAIDAIRELGLTGRELVLAYQMLETFTVGAILFESGAQSRGMSVRTLRYQALEASDPNSTTTVDVADVVEMSEQAFWNGIDRMMASIEGLVGQAQPR